MCKWNNCILCFIISNKSNGSFWHFHRMESKSTYRQWKRNELFTKFSTDSNEISTFQPEFNVNLNNHASTLSKILSQSRSTINSNLSEPGRLFTTTSQPNPVMSSNLLVSFQPPPYPDPPPDQFCVAILYFVSPKTQSCIGCVGIHKDIPLTKASVCTGFSLNCLSRKIQRTSANSSPLYLLFSFVQRLKKIVAFRNNCSVKLSFLFVVESLEKYLWWNSFLIKL